MSNATPVTEPGMFALVLHSHLPWLANHGRWPVGEEWLYQSWAASYLPLAAVLRRLADEGRSHLLTLGITPVLAAQLDDPHCLAGMHHWLGNWQIRAHEAAGMPDAAHRELGAREHRASAAALEDFETHWRHGGSPGVPRPHRPRGLRAARRAARPPVPTAARPSLAGVLPPRGPRRRACPVEPHSDRDLGARVRVHPGHGARVRRSRRHPLHGRRPRACAATRPSAARFANPTWLPSAATCRSATASGPRSPDIPGHAAYRDFHTYDHETGLKPSRVTGRTVDSADKAPYDPELAAAAVDKPRRRLRRHRSARVCAANPPGSAATPSWSPHSTPNCSGTGGTRARSGSRSSCARCPRPEFASAPSPTPGHRGYVGEPVQLAGFVLGIGQGLARMGRRSGRPTSCN